MNDDETTDAVEREYDVWRMEQEERAAFAAETHEDRELAEHLADGAALPYIAPEFVVDNDEKAQWALRKLSLAQAEKGRIEAAAKREMERVAEWRDRAVKSPRDTIEKMDHLLAEYRRRLDQENPKRAATYKLPSGDLKRVPGGVRVEVTDEAAFTQWALVNLREAVKVSPLVSVLKAKGSAWSPVLPKDVLVEIARTHDADARSQLVSDEGELAPGVEYVVDPPSFKVVAR